MEYAVGIILGLAIGFLGKIVGFDRERSSYPIVLIVIASYYVLFSAMGDSYKVVLIEILFAAVFFFAAIIAFSKSLWVAVIALIAHGLFDFTHHTFITNPAVPDWWPGFCLAIDVTLGVWLAGMLLTRSDQDL
ncbi:MAG: hypothetical protein RIC89_00850 [Pseudomonadales bacterium]